MGIKDLYRSMGIDLVTNKQTREGQTFSIIWFKSPVLTDSTAPAAVCGGEGEDWNNAIEFTDPSTGQLAPGIPISFAEALEMIERMDADLTGEPDES